MRNVLRKRIGREIKSEWKKYLALFVLLAVTIGFVAGMFVANGSMEIAASEAYEKYNIEDGNFTLKDKATDALLEKFEGEGIKIYEQFYKLTDEDFEGDGRKDARVRVFKIRTDVNKACVLEGEMPTALDEIAIDRMHADNSSISLGDSLNVGGREMTVTALIANSDYSTLFESNSDIMFDALTFDIAVVTPETYDALDAKETYQYTYLYNDKPVTDEEKSDKAETLGEQLAVLSATGGYLDDADAAEQLEKDVDEWTDFLEGIKAQADDLQARGDELQAKSDDLQARGNELGAQAADLQARATALEERGMALQMKMATMTPEEQYLHAAELKAESDAIQNEATSLENEKSALEEKSQSLTAEGDELKQEADALQAEADVLEARSDEINAVKDKLEALEPYEDDQNELTDFIPEYANQAIHFAPDDFGRDKGMGEVLLIVLVIVIAFIFAITISNTINSEAKVIGTLRASGYSRFELIRHYIAVPVIVTLISAVVGNILGYTVFKNLVVGMYYNSYSLPTYETVWSSEGFIKTTLYPLIIMTIINLLIVALKMRIAPLKFLRNDLSTSKRKKAIKLPKWGFLARFRIRVFNQNIVGYLTLFIGILFVMVLLAFAVGMPATLKNYQKDADSMLLSNYQYVLKDAVDKDGVAVETAEESAEKYSLNALKTTQGVNVGEELSVYGYVENSNYFDLPYDLDTDEIYISSSYAEKFDLNEGDSITLKEKYTEKNYDFIIAGIHELKGTLCIFMPNDNFNEVFGKDAGDFTGYLSNEEITDIDDNEIINVYTADDVLKMVNQLDHSIGAYMDYFAFICVLVAMLIIYLLTKLIIEKNAISISMVKVLGYSNREINGIYIGLTTVVVIISAVITAFLSLVFVDFLWKEIMYQMTGWFTFYISPGDIVKIIVLVIIAYLIVMFFDMRRIKKIPLTEALKDVD